MGSVSQLNAPPEYIVTTPLHMVRQGVLFVHLPCDAPFVAFPEVSGSFGALQSGDRSPSAGFMFA